MENETRIRSEIVECDTGRKETWSGNLGKGERDCVETFLNHSDHDDHSLCSSVPAVVKYMPELNYP
jgi:hypothetical protein